jgi:hypothetical protein
MSLRLYMDVHVPNAITVALRERGVDVLRAQENDAILLGDRELLDRAGSLGRVIFSMDTDFLREAVERQRTNVHFAGVIVAHQLGITIRRCIDDLELVAKVYDPKDIENRIEYLPL